MPTSDYTPEVAEVGALMRARTADNLGNELGTFTADTRPTADNVSSYIQQATVDLMAEIGEDIDDSLFESAKSLVVYRAAMIAELSNWPEQIGSDRSPYEAYKELYATGLPGLKTAVSATANGAEPGSDAASGLPAYGFPPDSDTWPGMVGWGSRF